MRSVPLDIPQLASQSQTRARLWPPLALFALALLTRLPLQGRLLYHWDSVNFALALAQFDIALGQPHAPGYLLYVLLGRAAAWLMGGAQAGFVLLAILGSALAAVALYDLGRRMWDARVGWLAALLLLSSPLFWFYGEVALPHTLDAMAVTVAAALSWRVWQGERRAALLLALWLGLAGGLRQQTLVFLFPLAVVAGIRMPIRWIAASLLVLGLATLAWALPLFALSGGMARYFEIVRTYSGHFNQETSIFLGGGLWGLGYNLGRLLRYTGWGWALGAVPALLGALLLRPQPRAILHDRRFWLLLLWAAPCLAFYTLIHMGQQGLIFAYLPILMLLGGLGGAALAQRGRWGAGLVAACVAGNILLYLFAPAHLLPGQLKVLSHATVRQQDALLQAQIDAVHAGLPEGALLLADEWRFPQYYLPEVALLPYRHDDYAGVTSAPELEPADLAKIAGATALAWYEPEIDSYNQAQGRTAVLADHDGVQLRVLRRAADERFVVDASGINIRKREGSP